MQDPAGPEAPQVSLGTAWPLLTAAALAGAGVMAVELSAVRLLAPWFGATQTVWTNVIAVVLVALALGYAYGAQLAGRPGRRATMVRHLALGGALVAALPPLASWVAPLFVAPGAGLDEAGALAQWGSLAVASLLFLLPGLLLGTIAPLVTEELSHSKGMSAGQAGGQVLAVGTLGSLLGVFGSTYLLLPRLGLQLTFVSAGLALGAAALLLGARGRALVVLVGFAALLPMGRAASPTPGERVLATVESPYQHLQVLESSDGSRFRRLAVNEGLDSFQSVWTPDPGLLGGGYYYDGFALPLSWEDDPGPWRLAVLGLGAGTAVRVLSHLPDGPELDWWGIEIDPEVVRLAKEWFELDPDGQVLSGVDARVGLRGLPLDLDQLVLDCYANNAELPAHLVTLEFFVEALAHLGPGGWLSANVGGFGVEDPVVQAVGRTMAAALGESVLALEVPFSRNVILLGRRDAPIPDPSEAAFDLGPGSLATLRQRFGVRGTWQWILPGEAPLTDDWCPTEGLQRSSLASGRRAWGDVQ